MSLRFPSPSGSRLRAAAVLAPLLLCSFPPGSALSDAPPRPPSRLGSPKVFDGWNYLGRAQSLPNGRWDVDELDEVGNDAISSIEIPQGCMVTVYQHGGFRGASRTFFESVARLDASLDNEASSIVVRRLPTAFGDADFHGKAQLFDEGSYDVDKLQMYVGNDTISSVAVPRGWRLTAYQEAHFGGPSQLFTEDTAQVPQRFNDQFSSVVVEAPPTGWIRGVLRGEMAGYFQVELRGPDRPATTVGSRVGEVGGDHPGQYEFAGLAPGHYWLDCVPRNSKVDLPQAPARAHREFDVVKAQGTRVNFTIR